MPQGAIAAEEEASSIPKTAPENGHRPQGKTRISNEGVCVYDVLALPQCKLASSPTQTNVEATGKHVYIAETEPTGKTQDVATPRNTAIRDMSKTTRIAQVAGPFGECSFAATEAAADDAGPEVAAGGELTPGFPTTLDQQDALKTAGIAQAADPL
ncbi:hypothetical protein MJO29_013788 [Puccinia striiformis f. sp. tritici]|nr:hypothetical protein MJO29_013788 [Puccinia striiformis f. sp. tritici]